MVWIFLIFQSLLFFLIFLFLWRFLVSPLLVVLIYLALCSRLSSMRAASSCTNGQTGCHFLSLANLFDRVIQHSARMHGISNDLHSEFVRLFLISWGFLMLRTRVSLTYLHSVVLSVLVVQSAFLLNLSIRCNSPVMLAMPVIGWDYTVWSAGELYFANNLKRRFKWSYEVILGHTVHYSALRLL